MLVRIRRLLQVQDLSPEEGSTKLSSTEQAYRLAATALLVEMMRADFEDKAAEREAVTNAVQRAFQLSDHDATQLIEAAHSELDEATSLHRFTAQLNEHLDHAQKIQIVELLWEVAYADGELHKYEDYLVRKVADLLYLKHREFIQAKHRIASRYATGRLSQSPH